MTVAVSPIYLLNVEEQMAEAGELWDKITEKQLEDWEGEWLPELFKAVQRQRRAGIERRHWPQSRHWNWRTKTEAIQGFLAFSGYSIVCDGMTQGMMLLDSATKQCRIKDQQGKNLVYVDYLENAPWNRPELRDPPLYRGVGSIMIRAAIELSLAEEFKGRIGLHSLPQANSFYANTCGMSDLGVDSNYQNLRYFEMTTEQAQAFMKKGDQP